MDTQDEVEIYVCWEYYATDETGKETRQLVTDPIVVRWHPEVDRELLNFKDHSKRTEILALADLVGREEKMYGQPSLDGRSRYSNNFKVPAEWFERCQWEKIDGYEDVDW